MPFQKFKTTEKKKLEFEKWPSGAAELAHLVVIATHEFNFYLHLQIISLQFFSAIRMSSLSSFACRAALNLNELTNLAVEKKKNNIHALYHEKLYWYDMRCFFFCFQHFSFPFYITIVQREKKSGNQRKREKQKKKQRPKREKSNNANESSHQLNKEKTQCDIIFVSLLFYQCTLNFFFNFSTHFSLWCLCENFNKPTLLYNI